MSRKREIEFFIKKKLAWLDAEAELSEGKGTLANLRRGIGRRPGELPEMFGSILLDMPEEFFGKTGEPTKEEWASYISLTLYALHQQGTSAKTRPMHTEENVSIGMALARLASEEKDANNQARMLKRLKAIATANDMGEVAYHLRGIVQLLKREMIPLNYSQLAGDLYDFQYQDQKSKVCLRWGQDFYRNNEMSENGGNKDE